MGRQSEGKREREWNLGLWSGKLGKQLVDEAGWVGIRVRGSRMYLAGLSWLVAGSGGRAEPNPWGKLAGDLRAPARNEWKWRRYPEKYILQFQKKAEQDCR